MAPRVMLSATTLFAENFDHVPTRGLPAGWSTAGKAPWATRPGTARAVSKAVSVRGPASVSSNTLTTPAVAIPAGATHARLAFELNYAFSKSALPGFGFDGMVLEVSISTVRHGRFQDVSAAGATFANGGFDGRLVNGAGRRAWVGSSHGPITAALDLPASAAGAKVRFRFREMTDRSRASAGATVDDVRVTADTAPSTTPGDGPGVDRVFGGTAGNDDLRLLDASGGRVEVRVNGVSRGVFAAADRFVLRGGAGDDTLVNASANARDAFLFGDDGRDTLTGGGGDDVLVGGTGDDFLSGDGGRDVLIGGYGSDSLAGGGGDDLLISGFTIHDDSLAALGAVRVEWGRPDADYEARLGRVRDTGLLDQTVRLNDQTVFGNGVSPDTLVGGDGRDVFYFDPTRRAGLGDVAVDRGEEESAVFISF